MKILAIIHHQELQGISSYGYNIWGLLKRKFFLYMDDGDLRNVYRHLKELNNLGLIERGAYQTVKGAPKRQPYMLTDKGRGLKQRFDTYLVILQAPESPLPQEVSKIHRLKVKSDELNNTTDFTISNK